MPVGGMLVTERRILPVAVEADLTTLFFISTARSRTASRVLLPDAGANKIPNPAPTPTPSSKPTTREGQ